MKPELKKGAPSLRIDIASRNSDTDSPPMGSSQDIQGNLPSGKLAEVFSASQSVPKSGSVIALTDLEDRLLIGKGSSGAVYKARHKSTKAIYAVKVTTVENSEEIQKQISVEVKALLDCNSPHVVAIFAAFYLDASVHMILEYMDGTLADIMKRTRIPEDVITFIAPQILNGLFYLHKTSKLIHRDIKPSNILVNFKGNVKISDFSVSGTMNTKSRLESFVGTVIYMSPERLNGSYYSYDSDIWSFGLSLMECIDGKFPYLVSGRTGFYEILDLIVESDVPQPGPEYSNDARDFIGICIQKEPKNRASVPNLLNHPFLTRPRAPLDLGRWFKDILSPGHTEPESSSASSIFGVTSSSRSN